ncbi:TPA: glutamate--tRNA ligase [Candidatus Dependentiae bacterium]|nr:MAG: Glutamate-tRNA ligase [candidate division TM6 bacterium GW2011_GWE2_31_21]KKP53737.1 MAG: Glutamate-tRNA ligase [candidate division TM6 bacterium GW2011_GWF2_33_332]HBS48509.1 glutamate--tRNA ligase [Candidatus Dependentiae bacterium]HBZ73124.1 glutamate--tRNA ligase [Candidatus Dependentiae bacterium]
MKKVRVRFAPSPTGKMHLGSVRIALFNYLFAKQKNGSFILRIEDTDTERNMNSGIIENLNFLNLTYDEGPIVGGSYGPYLQSERTHIYQEKLDELIQNQKIYRCFCTPEELETKKKIQQSKGEPPRYDRTCLHLSDDMIKQKLQEKKPFVWRLAINHDAITEINTLDRGIMKFELKNFTDFAITRSDGSFTFLFTNAVDDWLMKVSHVIRGDDHLSNTAMQAAIYEAFATSMPIFWHLPMICNEEGKILSKRDFGSSLDDLIKEGFLPQTILNYLAAIGTSLNPEVQSLDELVSNYNFEHIHASGAIKYNVEKLKWYNHKWINLLDENLLFSYAKPFINLQFPESNALSDDKLLYLVNKVKNDAQTLKEIANFLSFYFEQPKVSKEELENFLGQEKLKSVFEVIILSLSKTDKIDFLIEQLKHHATEQNLKIKEIFGSVRYMLTGKFHGLGMHDLLNILEWDEIKNRIDAALKILNI